MPHKKLFTHAAVILLKEPVSVQRLTSAIPNAKRVAPSEGDWQLGGPRVVVPYRPEVNGHVLIDVVDRPWPDSMGDPESEPSLFGAWALGYFGPCTYPGGLHRATLWASHWPKATDVVPRHRAFVRILLSYVLGLAELPAHVVPSERKPVPELHFITQISRMLLPAMPSICYFNPGGETLHEASSIDFLMNHANKSQRLPYELWVNLRVITLGDGWTLMDTVGMGQLDTVDHEAAFETGKYDFNEVSSFLRTAADYIVDEGPVIQDGDTMDGPGGVRWQGVTFEKGLVDPPRQVLRWLPMDRSRPPRELLVRRT